MRLRVFMILLLTLPLVAADEIEVRKGAITENLACVTDPTQTYSLYLPSSWDPESEHPVLLVFDPRQRGTMALEIFRSAAEELGWVILSSNDTRSDGPMEPNIRAIKALWPEIQLRYSIDLERIYATGFSGGGMLTLVVGTSTGELAGAINCGGRMPDGVSLEGANFAHYGTAGRLDFNYVRMHEVEELIAREGVHHRLDIFEGRHQWLDPELARTAMRWLEVVAMQEERRPVDRDFARDVYDEDLERGRQLEEAGRIVEAVRQYRMMVRTFEGLVPTEEVAASLERLEGSDALEKARREREKAERLEASGLNALAKAAGILHYSDRPVPPGRLRGAMRLEEMKRSARQSGEIGEAAKRVLEAIHSQTSFYFPRQFFASGEMAKAATMLEIAVEIHPDMPFTRYNLACAYARLGEKDKALDQLRLAVDHGFRNVDQLRSDPDLEGIRSTERFQAMLEELSGAD